MASRLESYAQWLVDNQDKRGTPEFDTVAQAYKALRNQPAQLEPAPSTERTFGEAAKDVAAGLTTGVGSLVQLPGQLYGLATGDFSKTGALGLGEDIQKYGEEMKSAGLKAREAARAAKVQEAEKEGQLSSFMTALGETVKDPALLTTFLAEQAPQLIPMILSGVGAGAIASRGAMSAAAARNAAREAAGKVALKEEAVKRLASEAAVKAGTTSAIQTGAVMQGADVGAGAYDEIFKELRASGMSEEQAAAETINKARLAGVAGYGLSVLANRYLPGGKALEEVLAGKKLVGGRLGTAAVTGLKEIPGENIEEVGGRIAQNIAAQQAGLDRATLSGVGETAAMATLGAAGMGGGAGLLAGRARTPEITPPPAPPEEPTAPEAPAATTTPTTEADLFSELILGEKKPEPAAAPATIDELKAEYEAGVAREAELRNKPKGEKTKEETIEMQQLHQKNRALKKKLDDAIAQAATQGAQDVAGTEPEGAGAGVPVSAPAATELPAAEGTVAPERAGVVPAGQDVGAVAQREAEQPAAITQTTGETLGTQAPQAVQAETQGQEAPAAAPVTTTAAPSEEVKKEMGEKVRQVAELYDEEREYAKLDDDGANLYDALQRGQLPKGMELGSARLDDVLDRNELELPDLPDNFESLPAQEQEAATADAINDLKQQIDDKRAVLVPWEKLTDDQRQVYLDNIRNNTAEEHARARRALARYRKQLRETQGKPKDLKADPAAGIYERNRQAYKSRDRLEYPAWDQLSEEQRALYNQTLADRQVDPKQATAEDHDAAFRAVAEKLVEEGYVPAPGMTYADVREAQLKKSEAAAKERAQREMKEERKPTKRTTEKKVPDSLLQKIAEGDLGAVLNWLSTSIPNPNKTIAVKLQRLVAARIKALGLNTKIKFVESLPDGDIAQYDPKTDTILVTEEGATPTTLLHELVHAATVKILDRVANNDVANLTPEQIDAANQLDDIMSLTARDLAELFPNAYKNIFEFVSEAISNPEFQAALKKYPATGLEYTLTPDRSALSRFIERVVEILNLKNLFTPSGAFGKPNLLSEAFTAFESIIETPEGEIERAPLPAKRVKAPELPEGVQNTIKRSPLPSTPKLQSILGSFSTYRGRGNIIKQAVNERIMLKRWQDGLAKAGKIVFGRNDIYAAVLRSTGVASDLFKEYGQKNLDAVQEGVIKYAKAVGVDGAEALRRIGTVMIALHEPERRATLFKIFVPLQNQKVDVKYPDGKTRNVSPAQVRKDIFRVLDQNKKLDPANMKYLQDLLDTLTKNHVDPNGFSGLDNTRSEKRFAGKVNIDDSAYNVAGQSTPAELKAVLDTMYTKDSAGYKELNDVVEALKKSLKVSETLNKKANYWTQPVDNRVEFYGWNNYVPMRGKLGFGAAGKNDVMESQVEPTQLSTRMSQYEKEFFGRESDPDNAVLLVMTDMAKAAMRNGLREISSATVNAINDKLLPGTANQTIKFEDRHSFEPDVEQKTIFHYEPNGDIRIVKIGEAPLAEAIKGTFKKSNPLVDTVGAITSFMGKTHTRYNLSFAPVDFVRNVLTNAALMGADQGVTSAAKYISNIAGAVVTGGLRKGWIAGSLYETGNLDKLKRLAGDNLPYERLNSKQQFYRDTLDYIQRGGKISYLKGISSKTLQEEVESQMSKFGFLKEPKTIEKFLNKYTDMFELATRIEAFRIARDNKLAELIKDRKPKTAAERNALREEAAAYATYYTKDLANFEQTGKLGRELGAWFMFWRPAATGAYRAIESLAPMFQNADYAMKLQLPRTIWDPESKTYDAEAVKKFKEKHTEQQKSGYIMLGLMAAMGVAVYSMAAAMSDDDEMGRNKALYDDPAQWTRYARFHIPGFDNPIRIPWGFGLGAFASAGAQFAMAAQGNATMADALKNTFHVALDSFLPLPFSKVDPTDKPAVWLIDSLTPAPLRPMVEHTLNVDGLGRRIYNDTQSKYSNVFVAGFNIPEIYKDVSRLMYKVTNGAVEITPNSLYFFATNYADGIVRPITTASNLAMVAYGSKDFSSKTDLPILGGFVGAPSNVDAKEFADAEKKVLALRTRLDTLQEKYPEKYAEFVSNNPMAPAIVEAYNDTVNGELKKYRGEVKEMMQMDGLTPKERNEIVKSLSLLQNIEKRILLDTLKAYGL